VIDVLPAHLLRGHVGHGAHDHARLRGAGHGRTCGGLPRWAQQLGQTEVENLDAAVAGDEEVLGFEVAVDDALLVGGGQARDHLDRQLDGLAGR
jgi:hypothetical protein